MGSSTIEIQRADLEQHRTALIELLRRYLTERSDEKRYDWFYRDNPRGRATVWIATDARGDIVGSAAIVPQRVHIAGAEHDACAMADFWVHPSHRVLGPALRLQRACIDGARDAGIELFIDLPQGGMPAVYKRLGVPSDMELVRFARPLSAAPHAAKLPLPGWLTRGIGSVGTSLLAALEPSVPSGNGLEVAELNDAFGPEFDELYQRARASYPLCVARSSSYLEWRYRRHYHLDHRVVTARRDGQLLGYAVLALQLGTAQLVDLFGARELTVSRALLAAALALARRRGATVLNVPLLKRDPLAELARSMWFRARGTMPVIVHALNADRRPQLVDPYLTYGDLDY